MLGLLRSVDTRSPAPLFDGKAFKGCGVAEALIGGEEREMLRLFPAKDESGGELEGVGRAELMDAEETDGTGADFIVGNDLGPLLGNFDKSLPCRIFDVRG